MYCAKCGTLGQAGHTSCVKCGAALSEHPYQAPRAPVTAPPAAGTHLPYAGFWVRAAAYVIDYLIVVVVFFVVAGVATVVLGPKGAFVTLISLLLIPWLYYVLFESLAPQATPGKLALGLRVTNEAGDPLGFGPATGRFFGKIISALTLGVGYAMAVFTERRQTLHDKMAGALVVQRRFPTHEIASAGPAPPVSPAIAVLGVLALVLFGPGGLGILSAIAIPAYQDFTIRTQVAEGLNLVAPYKAAIADAAASGEAFDAMTTESLKLSPPATMKYVDNIEVVGGALEIRYGAAAHRNIAGKTLVLLPGITEQHDIVWVCGHQAPPPGVKLAIENGGERTSIAPKYLPMACRAPR